MTNKETLHQLVEQLPEEQADLACSLLEDLHNAADLDGPPLDADGLASLDRGLADISAGRGTCTCKTDAKWSGPKRRG